MIQGVEKKVHFPLSPLYIKDKVPWLMKLGDLFV